MSLVSRNAKSFWHSGNCPIMVQGLVSRVHKLYVVKGEQEALMCHSFYFFIDSHGDKFNDVYDKLYSKQSTDTIN